MTLLPVSDAKTDFSGHRHMMLSAFDPSSSEELSVQPPCSTQAPDPYQRIWSRALYLILTWYMFLIIMLCNAEPFQEA